MPNDYRPDPQDFNIIATRIHRAVFLRRQVERTILNHDDAQIPGKDELDSFYILLIEHALAMIKAIRDSSPTMWTNPSVGFLPGDEQLMFTWVVEKETMFERNVLDIFINFTNMRYETWTTVNIYPAREILYSSAIQNEDDMVGVWLQWLMINGG